MAALAFFGYFFLGLGPGIAFFCVVIAPKSFLVLLSFTSAFFWLLTLLVIAGIFRGFLPLAQSVTAYAGLLLGSVAIQEIARHGLWLVHRKTVSVLQAQARSTGHRFDLVDQLYLALGWGYGHAAAHAIFLHLSFLPLTTSDGTWYLDACPDMSMFLSGCLYCLAFGPILICCMVVSFEGYATKSLPHIAYAPLMHFGCALLTLLNFKRHACVIIMPVLVVIGLLNVAYAAQLCWRKGAESLSQGQQPGGGGRVAAQPPGVQGEHLLAQEPVEDETSVDVGVGTAARGVGAARRRQGTRQADAAFPIMQLND